MSSTEQNDAAVTIREIMTTDIITTSPEATVDTIAEELRSRGYGGLPVVDENGYLIGMVSEYDIISKRGKTVRDIMSRGVISVGDEASAEQVTTLMGLHGIRRVPIVREGKLVGLVTRSDLLRLYSLVRWTCQTCGDFERGLSRPEKCTRCGSTDFALDVERRTGEGF
ncbi:MAG: CBS domain-containing protein [Thermomicrobiales bacterium]|nr:CBS domain-containing protein [Thermomicrobiales bacterium]